LAERGTKWEGNRGQEIEGTEQTTKHSEAIKRNKKKLYFLKITYFF